MFAPQHWILPCQNDIRMITDLKNTFAAVVNVRYNIVFANYENSHIIANSNAVSTLYKLT